MDTPARLLTTDDLADRWQRPPATLRNWRNAGTGPCYLRIGGQVRYRLADVEAFEAASVVDPSALAADDGDAATAHAETSAA